MYGLLGPNGAGKTTLIRLMLGFLHPSSGRSLINGIDPTSDGVGVRRNVAYLPGDARLPRHMRGSNVLRFFSEMHPGGDLDRSRELAERLELDTKRHVAFMSTGMRQKLALSVVLAVNSPLVILDEPTANLDPTIRAIVLDLVTEARRAGRTVIFSSHVLGEIEQTCDRVGFLRRGLLNRELRIDELFQRHRITALSADQNVEAPESIRERVQIRPDASLRDRPNDRDQPLQIDTAGDLADFLPWLNSLSLTQVRIEPLGLRAVYDAVHFGQDSAVLEDEA